MSDYRLKFTAALLSSTMFAAAGPAFAQEDTGTDIQAAPTDEIVVRGAYIPDEKRVTSEITSLLDSQDFETSGDADIASALTRITGIAVADDKFAVVRGLNDRYSNTLLNGALVSSPEPLRRAVPMDLFPTSIIGSATVQKTYAPEFGLDFGGGVIALETVALPDSRFLEIGVSGKINSATTLRDGLLYNGGGDSDYSGFDDGRRNLPEALEPVFADTKIDSSVDPAVRQGIATGLADWTDFVVQKGELEPSSGFSIEAGDRFDLNPDFSLGVIAALAHDNEWSNKEGVRRNIRLGANGIETRDDYARFSTEQNINQSALLQVGADILDNHTVTATGMLARASLKEARTLQGFNASEGRNIRIDNTEWYERQVWLGQLRGEHIFPALNNASIDWRASYSEAMRDAPYNRQLFYEEGVNPETGEQVFRYRGRTDGNLTEFSKVEDDSTDVGIDGVLPVTVFDRDVELKAGWGYYEKNRDTFLRQYRFSGTVPSYLLFSRIDSIYSPENVQAGLFDIVEVGGVLFPDNFRGLLEIDSGYVGVDAQLTDYIRIAAGGRYEQSIQVVDTFNVGEVSGIEGGSTITDFDSAIESEYFLPALTLTWNPLENTQLRLAYSQTIARPQFRETAFSIFQNTETDATFRGNPYLTNSEFENFDARLEYYFSRGQFVTLGAFYKKIDNPIEEFNISLGETFASSFLNAPSADLYGLEFEFEKTLPVNEWLEGWFGFTNPWLESKAWNFKTNYTWTQSEVSADGEIRIALPSAGEPALDVVDAASFIVDGRNLQGLSENLFNIQLGYEDDEAMSRATLLVNFTGERIRATENLSSNLPAILEEPPITLDFVYSRDFMAWGGDYTVGFQVDNILDDDYEASQSDGETSIVVDQYDLGRTFSVSLKRRF